MDVLKLEVQGSNRNKSSEEMMFEIEPFEVAPPPVAPRKFPTKYVVLGMGLSLAAIGIVLVRKKKKG